MAPDPETTAKRAELPMRLTRLRVKNFRSIADIDIPLSPLTVLVGPNGSGKSNVVDALRFVRDVFARGLDQAVMDREGMGVIQRWGTEGEGITIGMTVELAKVEEQKKGDIIEVDEEPSSHMYYEFTFLELANKRLTVKSENVKIVSNGVLPMEISSNNGVYITRIGDSGPDYTQSIFTDSNQMLDGPKSLLNSVELYFMTSDKQDLGDEIDTLDTWSWVRERTVKHSENLFSKLLFYTLNPSDLRQPQQLLKYTPLDEKGRNLAAVLASISSARNSIWIDLQTALRQTIAGFDTVIVEKVGGYLATKLIYHNPIEKFRTSYLAQESDGTIRMLGLLTSLCQEPVQPFISIEEPEANIHPGALAVLAEIIEEASLRSQILVTTHSPDMLDHLPVESFLVVEKVGDTTHVGPLDASQIASVRKRLFTPGELFRMEGLQRQTEPESAS